MFLLSLYRFSFEQRITSALTHLFSAAKDAAFRIQFEPVLMPQGVLWKMAVFLVVSIVRSIRSCLPNTVPDWGPTKTCPVMSFQQWLWSKSHRDQKPYPKMFYRSVPKVTWSIYFRSVRKVHGMLYNIPHPIIQ